MPEQLSSPRPGTWNLNVFPNPASDQLTLVSNKETDELYITITDLSGRKVLSKTIRPKDLLVN